MMLGALPSVGLDAGLFVWRFWMSKTDYWYFMQAIQRLDVKNHQSAKVVATRTSHQTKPAEQGAAG